MGGLIMKTAITLEEFLFYLNQDEDCRITLVDFDAIIGEKLYTGWKSSMHKSTSLTGFRYADYKNWFVQDFILSYYGMEICICKQLEE